MKYIRYHFSVQQEELLDLFFKELSEQQLPTTFSQSNLLNLFEEWLKKRDELVVRSPVLPKIDEGSFMIALGKFKDKHRRTWKARGATRIQNHVLSILSGGLFSYELDSFVKNLTLDEFYERVEKIGVSYIAKQRNIGKTTVEVLLEFIEETKKE